MVKEEVVVVVVRVLEAFGRSSFSWSEEDPLSETTYCNGSVATGSLVFVSLTAPTGSVEAYSFS